MAHKYFETRKRDNGETFTCCTDDAPEWLKDAVQEAHADSFPNDWVYSECRAAFDAYEDGCLVDSDDVAKHADGQVDVYTKGLAKWYADFCTTSLYSDAEGEAEDLGLSDKNDINQRLTAIQYFAIQRIAETIRQACEDNAEE